MQVHTHSEVDHGPVKVTPSIKQEQPVIPRLSWTDQSRENDPLFEPGRVTGLSAFHPWPRLESCHLHPLVQGSRPNLDRPPPSVGYPRGVVVLSDGSLPGWPPLATAPDADVEESSSNQGKSRTHIHRQTDILVYIQTHIWARESEWFCVNELKYACTGLNM